MASDESAAKLSKKRVMSIINTVILGIVVSGLIAVYYIVWQLLGDKRFADQQVLCPQIANNFHDFTLPGIKRESLSIPASDGQKLDAWLFAVPGADKVAIVNHGNAGNLTNRQYLAEALTAGKVNVLLYDYRGYGKSTGQATIDGLLEDGITVYNYTRDNLKYKAQNIIEFGESIGSAVACHVAATEPCGALMLFAPLDSLPNAARGVIPILNLFPDSCFAQQLSNAALVKSIHAPLLIFHGKRDKILSPRGSERILAAANEPKTLVYLPDSGHNDMGPADDVTFRKEIAHFLVKLP